MARRRMRRNPEDWEGFYIQKHDEMEYLQKTKKYIRTEMDKMKKEHKKVSEQLKVTVMALKYIAKKIKET